jgi:hypothetical protein
MGFSAHYRNPQFRASRNWKRAMADSVSADSFALQIATAQNVPPHAKYPFPEHAEAVQIPGYCVVVEVALHNCAERCACSAWKGQPFSNLSQSTGSSTLSVQQRLPIGPRTWFAVFAALSFVIVPVSGHIAPPSFLSFSLRQPYANTCGLPPLRTKAYGFWVATAVT